MIFIFAVYKRWDNNSAKMVGIRASYQLWAHFDLRCNLKVFGPYLGLCVHVYIQWSEDYIRRLYTCSLL